ncbi:MAG TPA: hypothetical protein VIT87_01120 [Gemmatimonadales bacterium]
MTAVQQTSAKFDEDGILAPVLRAAHTVWIRETTLYLWPVFVQEAPFWERWTAVRYIADEFLRQYHLERAFVDELRPFLPPPIADSLTRDGERIGRLQCELDRVGRRRGTAHTVSVISRRLLHLLRSWCADIEAAAGRIPRGLLPPEGNRLVVDLELYTRTHA